MRSMESIAKYLKQKLLWLQWNFDADIVIATIHVKKHCRFGNRGSKKPCIKISSTAVLRMSSTDYTDTDITAVYAVLLLVMPLVSSLTCCACSL